MKFKIALLFGLLLAAIGWAAAPAPVASYELSPVVGVDFGAKLNILIAAAPNGFKITLKPGEYGCDIPIEWIDKNGTIDAEQAVLYPSEKFVPGENPFFTIGTSDPSKHYIQRQRINGLRILPGKFNVPSVGLRLHNANFLILNDVRVEYFDIAFQQYVSAGGYSFSNTLRDCYAMQAKVAFQQTGVADPTWGLCATGTTLDNFKAECSQLECLFDLQGQNNRIRDAWVQGGNEPYLLKSSGGGGNVVSMQYFEPKDDKYPLKAAKTTPTAIQSLKDVIVVPDRDNRKWVDVTGNIQVVP